MDRSKESRRECRDLEKVTEGEREKGLKKREKGTNHKSPRELSRYP